MKCLKIRIKVARIISTADYGHEHGYRHKLAGAGKYQHAHQYDIKMGNA